MHFDRFILYLSFYNILRLYHKFFLARTYHGHLLLVILYNNLYIIYNINCIHSLLGIFGRMPKQSCLLEEEGMCNKLVSSLVRQVVDTEPMESLWVN